MTTPENPISTARTARVIHGALVGGLILFVIVAHFFLLPSASGTGNLASITPALLALSLAGCVV